MPDLNCGLLSLQWSFPSPTLIIHCHIPGLYCHPLLALTLKLLIQNSYSLITTFIFPTCLQNYFHPWETQGIKEQAMCVSYRLDQSQQEELGVNRACLSPFLKLTSLDEKTQECHSRDYVALSPLYPTSRLSYFGFSIKPFITQGLTWGRKDW